MSCGVPKFLYDKDFCNVGVCMSIIVFEVLSKSLVEGLLFHLVYKTNHDLEQFFVKYVILGN